MKFFCKKLFYNSKATIQKLNDKIMKKRCFMKVILSSLVFLILFTGCSFSQLDTKYKLKNNNETVFVMGVNSDRYRLLMWPGDVEGDIFIIEDTWKNAAHHDTAKDGYIVGVTGSNDHVGFKSVSLLSKDKERVIFQQKFCQGSKMPVFTIPDSNVVYVGDMNLSFEEGHIKYTMTSDYQKAKEFIDANYPNLKGKLIKTEVKMLFSSEPCYQTRSTYIPIFI